LKDFPTKKAIYENLFSKKAADYWENFMRTESGTFSILCPPDGTFCQEINGWPPQIKCWYQFLEDGGGGGRGGEGRGYIN
jgi:hypothetical protein